MDKKKVAIIAASAVLGVSVVTAGAILIPKLLKGSLEMTDFVVNPTGIKTTYEIEEEVSFDGLVMTAFFNDKTTDDVALSEVKIYLGEEDITSNLSKITQTKGKKTVKIVYSTKYGEDFAEIEITVNDKPDERVTILGFNEPTFVSDYKANIANATNDKTDANFEQKFFANSGTEYYVVGDDNAFKFLPEATVFDEQDFSTETLTSFKADSTVKVLDGTEFVTLTKGLKQGETNVYEYYKDTTLLVTENATANTFDFADNTVGMVFELSVQPNEIDYIFDDEAVSFTVKIVDGFNVYKAGELSVFDNTQTEWEAIKIANGVANVTTNGVVLHQNTILESKDIPQEFYYTLPDTYNIKYKDAATGDVKTPEEFGLTRTFLWNQYDGNPVIFERLLQAGESFTFYGNYFDLDTSKMPLVASFWPDGGYGESNTYYGNDFSNTALFRAEGQSATTGEQDEHFNFYNLAMKGNAKPNQLVLSSQTTGQYTDETLVYAGGLICTKVDSMTANYDNVRTYNFFISLFAETKESGTAIANYNRTKVYDSFQDALFLWGNAHANITNSYMKRAGGPLILMQHIDPQTNDVDIPTATIDENSEMEAYLTGTEIWFSTVGGGSFIEQLKALDGVFNAVGKTFLIGKTSPTDTNGKMNIIALLTCNGNKADQVLTMKEVQGTVNYKGYTLDRMNTTSTGAQIHGIMGVNAAAPIFSFGTSVYYFNGTGVSSLTESDASMSFYLSTQSAEYFSFYMGGLSVMFELGTLGA